MRPVKFREWRVGFDWILDTSGVPNETGNIGKAFSGQGCARFPEFVPIHAKLDRLFPSNIMQVLTSTRCKTAKIRTIKHTPAKSQGIRTRLEKQ